MRIAVLALQGAFRAHADRLRSLGAADLDVVEARLPRDLNGVDGLVMPGGESTTMTLGIEREGLAEPLRALAASGTPVLGTCAGLIMLDRAHLGVMDIEARRNAFGRQVRSFEADLDFDGLEGPPVRAVFIRAPWIDSHGDDVEILASLEGHPIAARQGNLLAIAFHPELGQDTRLHEQFVRQCAASNGGGA
jgi:5'-phosphate synthase pdxT subunit